MTPPENRDPRQDRLQDAFDRFCENWFAGDAFAGDAPDPDAFCGERPDLGPELRERIASFLLVAEGISDIGAEEVLAEAEPSMTNTFAEDKSFTLGDFKILGKIGQGGMAEVFEAEQVSMKRRVALKILPPHLSFCDESVLKFYREAQATGKQSHPGIISIFAVGEAEGKHFIAEELVENGYTLSDELVKSRKMERLPLGYYRKAAARIVAVAHALAHSHQNGVIHRDVKPSNILITPDGKPKVTDFGLAHVEDALSLSRTGDLKGTPYYMSPEQATGRRGKIDHRTDIYSLGVTLYETLTLIKPFEGKTSHEVMKKILSTEPEDPRKKNPRVPRDLAVICLKAMEKDPERRYRNMKAFAQDLTRYLQGEVIYARPAGILYRFWKRVKRNPALSAALCVALVAVAGLVGSLPWYVFSVRLEKEEAIRQKEIAIKAKEEAEREAKRATGISGFLQNMLTSPLARERGKDVKVVDVLDYAAENLTTRFSDDKEIQAWLRNIIALTYYDLSLFNRAEPMFKTALEESKKHLGEQHQSTLAAMNNLATLFSNQGRYSDAESILRKVVEIQKDVLGCDDEITLTNEANLAKALMSQGKLEESEALHRSVLEVRRRIKGETDRDTLSSQTMMAHVLGCQGRYSESEALLREVLEKELATHGEDDVDTLVTQSGLAEILSYLGRYEESRELYLKTYEAQKRTLGEEHHHALQTIASLGSVLQQMGRFDEAEALARKEIEIQRRVLGDEHQNTLDTRGNLASVLCEQGRLAEAEALAREVLEIQRRVLGENHLTTFRMITNLATMIAFQGRLDEAEVLFKQGLDVCRGAYGEEHPQTLHVMTSLGNLLTDLKKYKESEDLLYAACEGSKKVLGEEHPQTLEAMLGLARSFSHQYQTEKAEPLLNEVLKKQQKYLGDDHPMVLHTTTVLSCVLMNQDKLKEAETLLREAVVKAEATLSLKNFKRLSLHSVLGECLLSLKKYEDAELHLLAAWKGTVKSSQNRSSVQIKVASLLIELYDAQDAPDKAAFFEEFLASPGDDADSED